MKRLLKRKRIYLFAVGIILESLLSFNVQAACTISGGVISSDCSGTTTWTSGNLIVNQGVVVNGQIEQDLSASDSKNVFLNNGSIGRLGSTAFYTFSPANLSVFINNGVMGFVGNTAQANAILLNAGTITSLTNIGSMIGDSVSPAIVNNFRITTLNNAQGVGNSYGPLTYKGNLPTNYNIIVRGSANYGQLQSVGSITGSTTFGVLRGSLITSSAYTGVLQGLTTSNVGATRNGTYGNLTWRLSLQSGSTDTWNLYFVGPDPTRPDVIPPDIGVSTADTEQSLINTSQALQSTFALQNTVLANSFSYDCNVFSESNVCVSAGGRNTAVSAANGLNNTSALLIAAYRPHPNYRIGAYADQNLSVNNASATVSLGNNTPLIGIFGAWNERLDGTGAELKISAAYGQKNTTINRQVVGTSEAGSGSSQLNSQGAQVTAKYGFGIDETLIVSPYVGMRYTQNNMGGYTENASSSVTAPLTYSALNTNATTALAGLGISYKVIPAVTTFASAGVETDTNTSNGSYYGSNSYIPGLVPVSFNANPVKTRPTATLGAYYDVTKNQRFGVTGIYRQEAYQAVSSTTVLANYTVGI